MDCCEVVFFLNCVYTHLIKLIFLSTSYYGLGSPGSWIWAIQVLSSFSERLFQEMLVEN